MRKLATIEEIGSIEPIPGADAIEAARVRGWTVVVRKGEFAPGDPVVYHEIDSALPLDDPRYAFLAPRGTKTYLDRKVHVLKTARLRGVYSQGLVIGLGEFPELADASYGDDVTDILGVTKYEPPLPASSGEIIGRFPTAYARTTDAERVQNLDWADISGHDWVATEKIDGTSFTFVMTEGGPIVASRNYQIGRGRSLYWDIAAQYDLENLIPVGMTVQGEIYGNNIQGNPLGVTGRHLAVFGITMDHKPVTRGWMGLPWVPILDLPFPANPDEALAQAEGLKSTISPQRLAEGIVWHEIHGITPASLDRPCFKVISNKYLAKP
jgi:RNA ligase (TIGR02306 family)